MRRGIACLRMPYSAHSKDIQIACVDDEADFVIGKDAIRVRATAFNQFLDINSLAV